MSSSWRYGKRSKYRAKVSQDPEEYYCLDEKKSAAENAYDIYTALCCRDTRDTKRLFLLNGLATLCQQQQQQQQHHQQQQEQLHQQMKINYLGFTTEELLYCLSANLIHTFTQVRAAALRTIRYGLTTPKDIKIFNSMQLQHLLCRSIDLMLKNDDERVQALKLIRKMLAISPEDISPVLVRCLVSLADIGVEDSDNLLRACLATLSEFAVLNPTLLIVCGGVTVITRNVLECHNPRIAESLCGVLLYLLEWPNTRNICGVRLDCLAAPYCDFTYRLGIMDKNKDARELRYTSCRLALLSIMRSWTGTIEFCDPSKPSGLKAIVDALYLNQVEVRKAILDLFYELLGLPHPTTTDDFTLALQALDPSDFQDAWLLSNGFVASEGRCILPSLASRAPNICEQHLSLLLYCFLETGLLNALVEVVVSGDTIDLAVRSTILIGKILHLMHTHLPGDICSTSSALPTLIAHAAQGNQQAIEAISALQKYQKMLRSRPASYSLFLDSIIQGGSLIQTRFFRRDINSQEQLPPPQPSGSSSTSQSPAMMGPVYHQGISDRQRLDSVSSSDESNSQSSLSRRSSFRLKHKFLPFLENLRVNRLIKDSNVLSLPDGNSWDWEIVTTILRSNLIRKLDDTTGKFLKRLVHHFKPSSNRFSHQDLVHGRSTPAFVMAGLDMIDWLLASQELESMRMLTDFFSDVSQQLLAVTTSKRAHDCLFSPQHMNNTMCQQYFLYIGRMCRVQKGISILTNTAVFEHLINLVRNTDHVCYVKLIVSGLDYCLESMTRKVLERALVSSKTRTGRLYTTQFLVVLLRARLPNFEIWGIPLIIQQTKDPERSVVLAAMDVLEEACHEKYYLEEIVSLWPNLKGVGDVGRLLMSRYYSLSRGLNHRKARIKEEIEYWKNGYNKRYVLLIEADTHSSLTLHIRNEDGYYSRRSCSTRPTIIPPNILPHLYGQLVQTVQGTTALRKHGDLEQLVAIVTRCKCTDDAECLELKAAIWAIGHASTHSNGIEYFVESNSKIYDTLVSLAKKCDISSIRAVCFSALGLIGGTNSGANILYKLNWLSVRHDRNTIWPVHQPEDSLQSNITPVRRPCEDVPPYNYISIADHIDGANYWNFLLKGTSKSLAGGVASNSSEQQKAADVSAEGIKTVNDDAVKEQSADNVVAVATTEAAAVVTTAAAALVITTAEVATTSAAAAAAAAAAARTSAEVATTSAAAAATTAEVATTSGAAAAAAVGKSSTLPDGTYMLHDSKHQRSLSDSKTADVINIIGGTVVGSGARGILRQDLRKRFNTYTESNATGVSSSESMGARLDGAAGTINVRDFQPIPLSPIPSVSNLLEIPPAPAQSSVVGNSNLQNSLRPLDNEGQGQLRSLEPNCRPNRPEADADVTDRNEPQATSSSQKEMKVRSLDRQSSLRIDLPQIPLSPIPSTAIKIPPAPPVPAVPTLRRTSLVGTSYSQNSLSPMDIKGYAQLRSLRRHCRPVLSESATDLYDIIDRNELMAFSSFRPRKSSFGESQKRMKVRSLDRQSSLRMFTQLDVEELQVPLPTLAAPKFITQNDSKGPCYAGICLPKNLLDLFPARDLKHTYVSHDIQDRDLMDINLFTANQQFLNDSLNSEGGDVSSSTISSLSDVSSASKHRSKWLGTKHGRANCLHCARPRRNQAITVAPPPPPVVGPATGAISRTKAPNKLTTAQSSLADTSSNSSDSILRDQANPDRLTAKILYNVQRLANPVSAKQSKLALLELKQKHPTAFQDICLYSEVCKALGCSSYRVNARRFLQELFLDLNFETFYAEPLEILSRKEKGGLAVMETIATTVMATTTTMTTAMLRQERRRAANNDYDDDDGSVDMAAIEKCLASLSMLGDFSGVGGGAGGGRGGGSGGVEGGGTTSQSHHITHTYALASTSKTASMANTSTVSSMPLTTVIPSAPPSIATISTTATATTAAAVAATTNHISASTHKPHLKSQPLASVYETSCENLLLEQSPRLQRQQEAILSVRHNATDRLKVKLNSSRSQSTEYHNELRITSDDDDDNDADDHNNDEDLNRTLQATLVEEDIDEVDNAVSMQCLSTTPVPCTFSLNTTTSSSTLIYSNAIAPASQSLISTPISSSICSDQTATSSNRSSICTIVSHQSIKPPSTNIMTNNHKPPAAIASIENENKKYTRGRFYTLELDLSCTKNKFPITHRGGGGGGGVVKLTTTALQRQSSMGAAEGNSSTYRFGTAGALRQPRPSSLNTQFESSITSTSSSASEGGAGGAGGSTTSGSGAAGGGIHDISPISASSPFTKSLAASLAKPIGSLYCEKRLQSSKSEAVLVTNATVPETPTTTSSSSSSSSTLATTSAAISSSASNKQS